MNVNKIKRLSLVCLSMGVLVGSVGSANAAELLVTKGDAKGGSSQISLDIVSDGDVSGFNFTVNLGKAGAGSAKLGRCVADLPKGFSGECRLHAGKVNVIAMADRMEALPAGVISVGSIDFDSSDMAKAGRVISIENLEFVDTKGAVLAAKSAVE